MPISRRRLLISIPILWMGLSLGCLGKKKQKELTFEEAINYWLIKYRHHHGYALQTQKYFKNNQLAKDYLTKALNQYPSKDYKQNFLKTRLKEFKQDQLIELNGYFFAPVEVALLRLAVKD